MRVLFETTHPAHVHCFKNTMWNLQKEGHEVLVAAKDKEVTLDLLDKYGFNYEVIGPNHKNLLKKAIGLLKADYRLLQIARKFQPDILVGRGSPSMAHLSLLTRKPYIALIDTENAHLVGWLSSPFATAICASTSYQGKIDPKKEVRFDGYKELAYLHPNYFKPDPEVLDHLGLAEGERFTIVRFVGWGATHDIKDYGFSNKSEVVKELSKYSRVFISSEIELPGELEEYRVNIPPEKMHHLLYYADLFIGESATMATESAILGTPAIFVSTSRRGYTDELEEKYDLMYTYSDPEDAQAKAVEKAIELLINKNTNEEWQKKRKALLEDKIDVTRFLTDFIEARI